MGLFCCNRKSNFAEKRNPATKYEQNQYSRSMLDYSLGIVIEQLRMLHPNITVELKYYIN